MDLLDLTKVKMTNCFSDYIKLIECILKVK